MKKLLKTTLIATTVVFATLCSTNLIAGEQYVWTGSASYSESVAQITAANDAPRQLKALPNCVLFAAGFGWMCVGEFAD
ncbi:MAG: hypothetical protein ACI9LM_004088 [Alteromonadaceae bacterium]|jgi:hypothetical protein